VQLFRFPSRLQQLSLFGHPSICSIYEVAEEDGRSFIVMQYVEGETLASRMRSKSLELGECVEIAAQVADVLAEAHSHGIIHRDIKPANIMLTARHQAKVMDFGLAKVVRDRSLAESEAVTESLLTEPGVMIGTVPYMSPEQVRGETLDARSDIFSVGATMYEMISGRRPFECASAAETISAILVGEPASLTQLQKEIPAELDRIVRKCLEKDRDRRYQSARELLVDLRNLQRDAGLTGEGRTKTRVASRRRGGVIKSVAILPLVNDGGDPNMEYLSDGITESTINSLSQLPRLKVMARSTVFRYKGRDAQPQEVGNALGVRAVLTGRVRHVGDRLIIGVELVDVADGSQLWGEQYNRQLADIFAVQEEIAQEIAENLRLKLSSREQKRLAKRYTEKTEAYQLYLKGRYYWNKWTAEGTKRGIEYFHQAIAVDPSYALAYAGFADCYSSLTGTLGLTPGEAFQRARGAAMKALALDDTLAEAHTSLAFIKLLYDWDWSGSEESFKRAIELDRNYPNAHHWYSHYLMAMGRIEESLAESRRALELDPLVLILNVHLGWHYLYARQYDQAIEQLRKTLEMDPYFRQAHL